MRFLILVSFVAASASAQRFSFQWLDALSNEAVANGVSGDGSVIVGWDAGRGAAVRWTIDGGIENIGPPSGGSIAFAVSADGNVIVGELGSAAFRWTRSDGMGQRG